MAVGLLAAGIAVGSARDSTDPRGPVPSVATSSSAGQPSADIRALLNQRVDAAAAADADRWLATTARIPQGAGVGVPAVEAERFDGLRRLPVSDLALTLVSVSGPPDAWVARVRSTYRLGSAPAADHLDDIDVVATPDGWRLGESEPAVAVARGGVVPPWYLPGVNARPLADGSTVLSWPQTGLVADEMITLVAVGSEAAFRSVAHPPSAVVVAVPQSLADYQALVPGAGEPASGFAAVTVDVVGPRPGGRMVVVNPEVWPGLDARERQVVLTHELVHVAVGVALGGGQPLWLAEGFADHVALQPVLASGVSRGQLAGGLLERAAAGGGPADLPGAEDFEAGGGTAYTTAWLAVDYIVRTYGEQAVLNLHGRLSGVGASADPREADEVLLDELGVTRAQLVTGWLADLATLGAAGAAPGEAPRSP